jgi:oxygen-dependent protoporphyrinogen oxidase
MIDVAVIGGGVSGLATAHALMGLGHQVVVLERQVGAGGNAVSERLGGFLMEHGPSSLSPATPEAVALWRELGLEDQCLELGAGVRRRYFVGDGALQSISAHPLGLFLSGYLSLGARARVLSEALVARGGDEAEETVAAFFSRRFGAEFVDKIVDPLVGGLYAAIASELSMSAVFPKLVEMEREDGSVTRGALRRWRAGGAMPARRMFSWRDGVAVLPRALVRRLGPAVRTGVAVRRIGRLPGGFLVEAGPAGAVQAKAVVVATQPHVAADLLDGVDPVAAEAAAAIDAPPLAVVFLGYRRDQVEHPLDGLGYLTARGEGRALTGAQFCSTMFAGRAPDGHVALAGYIGGARAPEQAGLPAAQLSAIVRGEFSELLGARGEPVVARVRQWPRGLPQYRLGHPRRVAVLWSTHERTPGLFVTGNYLVGPSVPYCLAQACNSAAGVDAYLAVSGSGARPGARAHDPITGATVGLSATGDE